MSLVVRHGDKTRSKVHKAVEILADKGTVVISNYPGHSCQKAIAVIEQVKTCGDAGVVKQSNALSRFEDGSIKLEATLESKKTKDI